jgi:hypothetical protein
MASGVLFALALSLAACGGTTPAPPAPDAAAFPVAPGGYEVCQSLCVRPSDCVLAYSSPDGYCPVGFRCTFTFTCTSDGGARD